METDRWQRLKRIVADALEQPASEHGRFVLAACGDDAGLRREAEAMLRAAVAVPENDEEHVFVHADLKPLASGTRVGGYRIDALLGEGGFSEVYAAQQLEPLQRPVAIKLLKRGMDSLEVLRRFELERETLTRLDHPHIAGILDAGIGPHGVPFLVMERIDGEPFDVYLERVPTTTLRERVELVRQVCSAVAHAHQRGVIHRDLKPSNVLITSADDAAAVKVIDFGIAKLIGDSPVHTQRGVVLGTPAFASPEQMQRDDPIGVDTRTDVFSVGMLLDHATTGSRAREIGWIVRKATEPVREDRYETMARFAADLSRFLEGDTVSVGPPTVRYRLRGFVRRHRLFAAAAAIAFVGLAVGALAAGYGLWRARQAEAVAVSSANREQQARLATEQALGEAEAVADYLGDLLAAPRPERDGREARVVDVLARCRALFERVSDRPLVLARVERVVGNSYAALGMLGDAQPLLESAHRRYAATVGASDERAVTVAIDVATVCARLGDRAANDQWAKAIERDYAEVAEPSLVLVHRRLDLLAKRAFDYGRPQDAIEPLTRVLAYERAHGTPYGVITVAGNLSQAFAVTGDFERAAKLGHEACTLAREHYGRNHPYALRSVRKLVATLMRSPDADAYDEASRLLSEAMPAAITRFGDAHPDTLGLQLASAQLRRRRGEHAEAAQQFDALRPSLENALGPNHRETRVALFEAGLAFEAIGQLPAAAARLGVATERCAAAGDAVLPEQLEYELVWLRVRSKLNQHLEIADRYRAAVERAAEVFAADSPRLQGARRSWATHLGHLAGALYGQERFGEAIDVLRRCHAAYRTLEDPRGIELSVRALVKVCAKNGDESAAAHWRAQLPSDGK